MENNQDNWMTPVSKPSLSKTVVEKIKEGIISGAIKPGEYLPSESELAERFGVGKSSIREAIKMLEAFGVVEICKGNGSRVCKSINTQVMNPLLFQMVLQSSTEKKEKLVELRQMIETSASLLAIDNASQEDIIKLQSIYDKTVEDIKNGNSTLEDDLIFHDTIYNSTHNPFVVSIGQCIMELMKPSLVLSNRTHKDEMIEHHKRILEALKAKDKSAMEEAIRISLMKWEELSVNQLP